MTNQKKSSVISRLNGEFEASITFTLPLSTLDKICRKANRRGIKPYDYIKAVLIADAANKEEK